MNILVFLLSWTKLGLQKLAETIFSYTFMLILKFNRMLVFFQREMELNFYLVKKNVHNSNGSFVTKFPDWSIKLRNISFNQMLSHQIKFSAKYLYSKPIISDVSSSESKLLAPRHVMVIVYQKGSIKLKLKVPQRQKFHTNFYSFLSLTFHFT